MQLFPYAEHKISMFVHLMKVNEVHTKLDPIDFHCMERLYKISYCVLHRMRKKVIQVWNNMRVNK